MQEEFYLHLWRRRYYKCDYREINKPLDNMYISISAFRKQRYEIFFTCIYNHQGSYEISMQKNAMLFFLFSDGERYAIF